MPLAFEKDSLQGLPVAGSIGVAQSRIGRAQRLTPPVFGLVARRAEPLRPRVPSAAEVIPAGSVAGAFVPAREYLLRPSSHDVATWTARAAT